MLQILQFTCRHWNKFCLIARGDQRLYVSDSGKHYHGDGITQKTVQFLCACRSCGFRHYFYPKQFSEHMQTGVFLLKFGLWCIRIGRLYFSYVHSVPEFPNKSTSSLFHLCNSAVHCKVTTSFKIMPSSDRHTVMAAYTSVIWFELLYLGYWMTMVLWK